MTVGNGEFVDLRERIAAAIRRCEYPSEPLERYFPHADAVLADLGLRCVARIQEVALGTGAEWLDANGEVIRGENPHFLPDKTPLYVVGFGSSDTPRDSRGEGRS